MLHRTLPNSVFDCDILYILFMSFRKTAFVQRFAEFGCVFITRIVWIAVSGYWDKRRTDKGIKHGYVQLLNWAFFANVKKT